MISAFMNTESGTLLIGVSDDGRIAGLSEDLKLFGASHDRFQNWLLARLLGPALGKPNVAEEVRVTFEPFEVCRVGVYPAVRLCYARTHDGKQRFFVRLGNTTAELDVSEVSDYIRTHWPSRGGNDRDR